ncbi:UPF0158 family protein [Pedobacter mucosus]|uniref:UPF0158 family protein n=1 Tax=Pedobacter mucosus TaxID=2895286 RepID=UPI001EE3A2B1|nr:UPF0158 family protein [Pedobacter mucosus]UKT64354.1 hypothetical protein LOK61_00935 [Pedobacter mucosus]
MKTFLPEEIKEISQQLDCGLNCYWNIISGLLMFVPNDDLLSLDEGGAYQKDIEFLEENSLEFRKIEKPDSKTAFIFMADFMETLPQKSIIKSMLEKALENKHPFKEFKFQIDQAGDYRELWFAFKNKKMQEYVKDQIDKIIEAENNSRLN